MKGINVYISHEITGPIYEKFQEAIDTEVKKWLESPEGKNHIKLAVEDHIRKTIASEFGYGFSSDKATLKFRERIKEYVIRALENATIGIK